MEEARIIAENAVTEKNAIPDAAVVIPAYQPDEKLVRTVEALVADGWKRILVVNDGSSSSCGPIFEKILAFPSCTLLTHPENRGKGAALKTAFSHLLKETPCLGAVTADADGQHTPEDIRKVASALQETPDTLILGSRDFSLPDVPKKSRMGNRITSFVFRTGVGLNIRDTQTGLRAIPFPALAPFLEIEGERYEYETNMLLALKKLDLPYREVTIRTVYIENNESSHFHPFRDSLRIYRLIFKFLFSSLSATLIDNLVFFLLMLFLHRFTEEWTARLLSFIGARLCSSVFNFIFNKKLVFHGKGRALPTLARYYALAIPQMLLSYGITGGLAFLFRSGAHPVLNTLLKICADTFLFFISFRIQKKWVFR